MSAWLLPRGFSWGHTPTFVLSVERCHSGLFTLKVSDTSCRVSGPGLPADPRAKPQSEPEASGCISSPGLLGMSGCLVKQQFEGVILRETNGARSYAGPSLQCWSGLLEAGGGVGGDTQGLREPVLRRAVVKSVVLSIGVTTAHPGSASLGVSGRKPQSHEGVLALALWDSTLIALPQASIRHCNTLGPQYGGTKIQGDGIGIQDLGG